MKPHLTVYSSLETSSRDTILQNTDIRFRKLH